MKTKQVVSVKPTPAKVRNKRVKRVNPAIAQASHAVTSTFVTPGYSDGRLTLYVEQEGRLSSRDMGIVRARVSVMVNSGEHDYPKSCIRAFLFHASTYEWKEVSSQGVTKMSCIRYSIDRVRQEPQEVLKSLHDINMEVKPSHPMGIAGAPDMSLVTALLHTCLCASVKGAYEQAFVQADLTAAWEGIVALFG